MSVAPEKLDWAIFDAHAASLGESPVWDSARQCLWWIDGKAGAIFRRRTPEGLHARRDFGQPIGSIGLTEGGSLIVALARSVVIWNPDRDVAIALCAPDLAAGESFNDGKTGPDGAFWVGTKGVDDKGAGIGRLFRITADGTATVIAGGLMTSNGLAWTADGKVLFHSDSKGMWIRRFDFDSERGRASDPRHLFDADEVFGRPDGAATDLDDTYWSCGVSAACINRFTRDGEYLARLHTPVLAPTMLCFGGPDLRTIFLTSLRRGIPGPLCGQVLFARVERPGVALVPFRGA